MREAKIQCVREYPIHDLALNLRVGDVVYVDAERARASSDLREAIRLKVVRVRYVERAQVFKPPAPRPPPPPNVRLARRRPAVTATEPTQAPPPPVIDMEAVKQAATDAVKQVASDAAAAQETVRQTLAEIKALLVANPTAVVAPQTTPTTNIASGPSVDAEPVFIPTNIVDKDASIRVTTTEAGDTDGLDAAAAALKNTRRGRKKKE